MFTYQSILNLVGVILSLTPFIGVGFYFGRLEKRIAAGENRIKDVHERVSNLELHLGV